MQKSLEEMAEEIEGQLIFGCRLVEAWAEDGVLHVMAEPALGELGWWNGTREELERTWALSQEGILAAAIEQHLLHFNLIHATTLVAVEEDWDVDDLMATLP